MSEACVHVTFDCGPKTTGDEAVYMRIERHLCASSNDLTSFLSFFFNFFFWSPKCEEIPWDKKVNNDTVSSHMSHAWFIGNQVENSALSGILLLRTTTTKEKEQRTLSSNKDPGLILKEMSVASSSVSAIPFNVRCWSIGITNTSSAERQRKMLTQLKGIGHAWVRELCAAATRTLQGRCPRGIWGTFDLWTNYLPLCVVLTVRPVA